MTLSRPTAASLLAILGALSCAPPSSRETTEPRPARPPASTVPGLSDPATGYRSMGYFAQGSPVSFVGSVHFVAGSARDSSLALLALSLANSSLSFQRSGSAFQAGYRVEATFRGTGEPRSLVSDQSVRVSTFSETQRTDETVIFQRFITLPPGDMTVTLVVRDQNTGGYSREERSIHVPSFAARPSISSIVPIYQGKGRVALDDRPDLIANAKGTILYGNDTLRLYLEAYGAGDDAATTVRVTDETGTEVWRGTGDLVGDSTLRRGTTRIPPGTVPFGKLRVQAWHEASRDTTQTTVLIGFSDQYVQANFEGALNLLRYFGTDDAIREMRSAPDSARAGLWRKFWRSTDPNPVTPENEAFQEYFSRLRDANRRFREGADPGWLTDRGEVYVGLGEPDDVIDQNSDMQARGRYIRWTYTDEKLVLEFTDQGFGRYRLTSPSRAEFQRVLARVRKR